MNLNSLSGYASLAKIGLLTFLGAFFGALIVNNNIPTTLDGWKTIVAPALGTAIAAELLFLRTAINQLISSAAPVPAPAPAAPAAPEAVK
jgi:hypothetical protein